jgi:predicted amidohydrolase
MKICVAQTRPLKGDILNNIFQHERLIGLAISEGADIIIFPELSLTGYEPSLAEDLATSPDDPRFDSLQKISNAGKIIIGTGMPTRSEKGIHISMLLFRPYMERQTYSKKYLHPDELKFFVSGQNITDFRVGQFNIALSICYELSVTEHAENASQNGAQIYIASVAKFVNGLESAIDRLSAIAREYSMTVLMSNCIGESDGQLCAGRSSVWDNQGLLIDHLDDTHEGIIQIDTDTMEVVKQILI